jgi:large subunit ribosomal protein L35
MPKLKTHKGAAKRFKKTGGGGYKHKKAYSRHILTKKNSKRTRQLRGLDIVAASDQGSIEQMLPYSR